MVKKEKTTVWWSLLQRFELLLSPVKGARYISAWSRLRSQTQRDAKITHVRYYTRRSKFAKLNSNHWLLGHPSLHNINLFDAVMSSQQVFRNSSRHPVRKLNGGNYFFKIFLKFNNRMIFFKIFLKFMNIFLGTWWNFGTCGNTVSAIILGEMEMWRCPDYLFPVAESRGGII